jgi:hypothetical protein
MNFGEFCKISLFIEKEKNKEKEKRLLWACPAHKKADPTARILLRSKKSPLGEAHSDLDILYQKLRSILKIIKVLPPFLFL